MKGQKGMDRTILAECAIKGIEVSKLEMCPRLSNVLNAISRLAPQIMLKQMTRMSRPKPREYPRRSVHAGRLGVQLNPRHRA